MRLWIRSLSTNRVKQIKALILIATAVSMAGCSTIGSYVEGWPPLKTTIHSSSLLEINQKCWMYLPTFNKLMGSVVFGCAVYNLDKKTCDVYVLPNSPAFILNHELAHCKGGDHPGGTLDKAYDYWLDIHLQVSDHYSQTPPRLLLSLGGNVNWDNSSKFGLIPNELFAEAQELCEKFNENGGISYKAIGYHPKAQDLEGKSIIGGGYFCAPE
jgi:hypothetical protein